MKRTISAMFLLLFVSSPTARAGQEPLARQSIINLVLALKKAGVSNKVIGAMLDRNPSAATPTTSSSKWHPTNMATLGFGNPDPKLTPSVSSDGTADLWVESTITKLEELRCNYKPTTGSPLTFKRHNIFFQVVFSTEHPGAALTIRF